MIEFKTLRTQIDEYIQDTFRLDGSDDLAQRIVDSVIYALKVMKGADKIYDFYFGWENFNDPEILYEHGIFNYHLIIRDYNCGTPSTDIHGSVKLYEPEFDTDKFLEFYNKWFPKLKDIFQIPNEDECNSWNILKAIPLEDK